MEDRPDDPRARRRGSVAAKTARNPDDRAGRDPRRAASRLSRRRAARRIHPAAPPQTPAGARPAPLGRSAPSATSAVRSLPAVPDSETKSWFRHKGGTCQPHNPRAGSARPSPLSASTCAVSPKSCRPQAAFLAMLARPEFCSCDQRSGLAETRTIVVTPGGHGKTQFAVQAQYLIGAFQSVELVICAGAAGSLAPQLSVGDVVVGRATVEHDYLLECSRRSRCRVSSAI